MGKMAVKVRERVSVVESACALVWSVEVAPLLLPDANIAFACFGTRAIWLHVLVVIVLCMRRDRLMYMNRMPSHVQMHLAHYVHLLYTESRRFSLTPFAFSIQLLVSNHAFSLAVAGNICVHSSSDRDDPKNKPLSDPA